MNIRTAASWRLGNDGFSSFILMRQKNILVLGKCVMWNVISWKKSWQKVLKIPEEFQLCSSSRCVLSCWPLSWCGTPMKVWDVFVFYHTFESCTVPIFWYNFQLLGSFSCPNPSFQLHGRCTHNLLLHNKLISEAWHAAIEPEVTCVELQFPQNGWRFFTWVLFGISPSISLMPLSRLSVVNWYCVQSAEIFTSFLGMQVSFERGEGRLMLPASGVGMDDRRWWGAILVRSFQFRWNRHQRLKKCTRDSAIQQASGHSGT